MIDVICHKKAENCANWFTIKVNRIEKLIEVLLDGKFLS